jgi:hypothetical protein
MTAEMRASRGGRPFGVIGLVVLAIGAVLLIVAFTGVTWYSVAHGVDIKFSTLHDLTQRAGGSRAPRWYFSWLAWLLLALVVVVGAVANVASPLSVPLRVLGLLLGIAGIAATYWALHKVVTPASVFDHASAGVWLAFAGYLLAGVGATIGPVGAGGPRA